MPWKDDVNGEPVYIPSAYVKEELPTWHEIYEFYQWCLPAMDFYDVGRDKDNLDPYWKLPVKLIRLIMMCNYLNKVLYESEPTAHFYNMTLNIPKRQLSNIYMAWEKPMDDTIEFIRGRIRSYGSPIDEQEPSGVFAIRWVLSHQEIEPPQDAITLAIYANPHTIYTFDKKENPFIPDKSRRLYIPACDINNSLVLTLYWCVKQSETNDTCIPVLNGKLDKEVLTFMLDKIGIIDYFKEPVGFKDKDGKVISEKQYMRCQSGYDPAL